MITKEDLKKELQIRKNNLKCEYARRSFYFFCQLLSPDFYTPDKLYLKELCHTLQKFIEKKLYRTDGKHYEGLIIQIPPRHGKTRTLTNLNAWAFGKNPKLRVISSAFTDDLANDFSRYTRDIIAEDRNDESQIIYRDIFPWTRLKEGNASVEKWALDGAYFSYKGAGVGGQITGKGGDILLIDDAVKDAEMAFNEPALNKLWLWYTSTWQSRKEPGALEIIVGTPWCKLDIQGRIQSGNLADDFYIISMPACLDEKNQTMLCDSILDYEHYKKLESTMDEYIFTANYKMERVDQKGLLYRPFQEYDELPEIDSTYRNERMITDPADDGECYLTSIYGTIRNGLFFVKDVVYTQEDIDKTEVILAQKLKEHKIDYAHIEDNGSGHNYAHSLRKELQEKVGYMNTQFIEIHNSKNKDARIFGNANTVNSTVIFPKGWRYRWPEFYTAVTQFSRTGKNKYKDAPDCLTMIVTHVIKSQNPTVAFTRGIS